MEEKALRIKEMFQDVISGFGCTHAKAFVILLNGEIKSARQLSEETGISHNKIYAILKDLIREKIVMQTNTNPANYYMNEPAKTYGRLVERKIALLEKKPGEFDKIILANEDRGVEEREYLIKITNSQTKLFDYKNKSLVKEFREAENIIRSLNGYAEKLETKKDYLMAVYR